MGLPGVWATVKYLIAVSPPDEKLVKRHARYPLMHCADAAMLGSGGALPSHDKQGRLPKRKRNVFLRQPSTQHETGYSCPVKLDRT